MKIIQGSSFASFFYLFPFFFYPPLYLHSHLASSSHLFISPPHFTPDTLPLCSSLQNHASVILKPGIGALPSSLLTPPAPSVASPLITRPSCFDIFGVCEVRTFTLTSLVVRHSFVRSILLFNQLSRSSSSLRFESLCKFVLSSPD